MDGELSNKMRIISGSLKGKSLFFLKNSNTRPLKDIVKENIFNILNHSNLIDITLKEAIVLDLYSGIGSFGLECISRGAKKVSFVEKDKSAYEILKKNLNNLCIKDKAVIFNDDIENFLQNNRNEKYNIFFFDPPFSDKKFIKNLNFLKKNKMYNNQHLIVIHREKNTLDPFEEYFNIKLSKIYGRSKIIFGIFN